MSSFFTSYTSCIEFVQMRTVALDYRSCQDSVQILYTRRHAGNVRLRIGELSGAPGVSPELLRAWERRYGLLDPVRSPGGLRLYSLADLERVRVMRQHLAEGLAAAEAAAAAVRAAEDASTGVGSAPSRHARARGSARGLRRASSAGDPRPSARRDNSRRVPLRDRDAVPARPRRTVGARRGHRRARALRLERASADGCSGSRGAGDAGSGRGRSSRAPQESSTSWD